MRIAIALCTLALVCGAMAQSEQFKKTTAAEIAKNPQRFWATGIIFSDTLVEAPGRVSREFNGRTYAKFRMKTVGDAYVDAVLVPAIADAKPNTEYVFTGTVLQEKGGFLWGSDRYVVLVHEFTATMGDMNQLAEQINSAYTERQNDVDQITLGRMRVLMNGIQQDVATFATNNGVALAGMYDPASTNRLQTELIIRAGIQSMADQLQTSSSEVLAQFVVALLAQKHRHTPAPEIQPVEATPAIAPDKPEEQTAEEGLPKLKAKPSKSKDADEKKSDEPKKKPRKKKAKKPAAEEKITPPADATPEAPVVQPAPEPEMQQPAPEASPVEPEPSPVVEPPAAATESAVEEPVLAGAPAEAAVVEAGTDVVEETVPADVIETLAEETHSEEPVPAPEPEPAIAEDAIEAQAEVTSAATVESGGVPSPETAPDTDGQVEVLSMEPVPEPVESIMEPATESVVAPSEAGQAPVVEEDYSKPVPMR